MLCGLFDCAAMLWLSCWEGPSQSQLQEGSETNHSPLPAAGRPSDGASVARYPAWICICAAATRASSTSSNGAVGPTQQCTAPSQCCIRWPPARAVWVTQRGSVGLGITPVKAPVPNVVFLTMPSRSGKGLPCRMVVGRFMKADCTAGSPQPETRNRHLTRHVEQSGMETPRPDTSYARVVPNALFQ